MTDRRRDDLDSSEDFMKPADNKTDTIRKEVERLNRKGKIQPSDYIELYNKFGNDKKLIDEIMRESAKGYRSDLKDVMLIAQKTRSKLARGAITSNVVRNIMKYAKDHNWSDRKMKLFRQVYNNLEHAETGVDYPLPMETLEQTEISRLLGYDYHRLVISEVGTGLSIKEKEHGILNEILSSFEANRSLHRSVFMHSLTYSDMSLLAMTGEFKRDKHIASNYIHPIIACMFLPKFDIFEKMMLRSNIGNIVKCRHDKTQINNENDLILFNALVQDPNDIVCKTNSPITDLRNRFNVQLQLWKLVSHLRSGNYYSEKSISEFEKAMSECRDNFTEYVEMNYNFDDGTFVRKLLSIFSLRPIAIETVPIPNLYTQMMGMQYHQLGIDERLNSFNLLNKGIEESFIKVPFRTITHVPLLQLRIPIRKSITTNATNEEEEQPYDMETVFNQTITIFENNVFVPKEQHLLDVMNVMVVYINRKVKKLNARSMVNPLGFSYLPMTMTGFDQVNDYPTTVPDYMKHNESGLEFLLRSVTAVQATEIRTSNNTNRIEKYMTGSVALLKQHADFDNGINIGEYIYDPVGASIPVRSVSEQPSQNGSDYFLNKPVSNLSESANPMAFINLASTTGTVFFYHKQDN